MSCTLAALKPHSAKCFCAEAKSAARVSNAGLPGFGLAVLRLLFDIVVSDRKAFVPDVLSIQIYVKKY